VVETLISILWAKIKVAEQIKLEGRGLQLIPHLEIFILEVWV